MSDLLSQTLAFSQTALPGNGEISSAVIECEMTEEEKIIHLESLGHG